MGIQFTGLASGLDTQSIIADLMKVERMKVESVEKDKTKMEWKKDAWSDANAKLYSFYKEELFDFKSAGTYSQKTTTSSNESVVTVGKSPAAPSGSHEITVTSMAKGSFLTGDALGDDNTGTATAINLATTADKLATFGATTEIKLHIKTTVGETASVSNEITIKSTDTLSEIMQNIKDLNSDLSINFDENFNRFFISSTKTGSTVQLDITNADGASAGDILIKEDLLTNMGFDVGKTTGTLGESAQFTYNNTPLESDTNDITVNGLSLTILADSGTTNISVNTNTDVIYDSVKSFITKYNELTLEFTTKLNADSARTFNPLTAEEKSAMTDDEVTLWEAKIKDSLLRRDDNLTSIVSEMRSVLTMSSDVTTTDMNYNYLSELGIKTGSYTENGILHIDGDEDDSLYSVKDNKLKAAIEDDPEGIMEFLSAVGSKLYEKMNSRMRSTTLSSSLTLFNDKYMDTQVDDYDTKIADLEERLAAVEARYYKQFTAMEQAIQQSNSTGDWLTQQLASL